MDHAISYGTPLGNSLCHFVVSADRSLLIPVITQIGRLIVRFRKTELTPQACHRLERPSCTINFEN